MIYSKTRRRSKIKPFFILILAILVILGFGVFSLGLEKGSGEIIEPLPRLTSPEKIELGLKELGLSLIGSPVVFEEMILATVSGGMRIYFKPNSDYLKELASLQLILKNIRIEGNWPKRIDLRYSRPIIEY